MASVNPGLTPKRVTDEGLSMPTTGLDFRRWRGVVRSRIQESLLGLRDRENVSMDSTGHGSVNLNGIELPFGSRADFCHVHEGRPQTVAVYLR